MFKVLVSLALSLFLVLFYFDSKNVDLPVFQMTNSPNVISKGHYGHTLILEVSYTHAGFEDWLKTLSPPYPLLLLDADWIARSDSTAKLIKEKQFPTGLYGSVGADYVESDLLSKQLAIYENAFERLPLWFTTADYVFDDALRETLFAKEINALSPSATFSFSKQNTPLADGELIAIPLHRNQHIQFDLLTQFKNSNPFISIEENLFGYTISTKRFP
ncbi:hypothetical protein [Solibacillus sp. FSL H8-0538]|uniref:hypothetical protein n=1 Tax=Solibacillus sp. FSL H8-0538 TaxID=2921400 RepID=UPI0030FA736D